MQNGVEFFSFRKVNLVYFCKHFVTFCDSIKSLQIRGADLLSSKVLEHSLAAQCWCTACSCVARLGACVAGLVRAWQGLGRAWLGLFVRGIQGLARAWLGFNDVRNARDLSSDAPAFRSEPADPEHR